jgi:XTP/dITP diphosphohydrolase
VRLDRVVVASHNPDKIAEIEAVLAILSDPVEVVRGHQWPEIEETEPTLEGNALLKARTVRDHTGLPALADDTGLEVAALGGLPGVRTARYSGPDATYASNVAKLLADLGDATDRRARFRTAVALAAADGEELVVVGELVGSIATAPRGDGGFGYDPVFEVDGRTLAEIGIDEKNRMSHRARALRALADALS